MLALARFCGFGNIRRVLCNIDSYFHALLTVISNATRKVVDLGLVQRNHSPTAFVGPVVNPIVPIIHAEGAVNVGRVVHLENGVDVGLIAESEEIADDEGVGSSPVCVVEVGASSSIGRHLPSMICSHNMVCGNDKGRRQESKKEEEAATKQGRSCIVCLAKIHNC